VENESNASFLARHEFLIRRLHSLSGLLPVGAYMVVHLLTNASVLAGAGSFQDNVDRIHSLGPALPLVEWTFIFLPIIFHAVVGVWIVRSGLPNTSSYRYLGNVRYTLQRATAWIALVFIFWHVFHMHGWIHNDAFMKNVAKPLFGAQFEWQHATSSAAMALAPFFAKLLYAIGMLSCVFHFANGLWTMGITWGLWITPSSQRRADYICAAVGILLAVVGLGALYGLSTANVVDAEAIETVRLEQQEELERKAAQIKQQLEQDAPSGATTQAPPRDRPTTETAQRP
jgi:succinate dehydrogenase / fumarate reductase cytochrome b subunit